MTTLTPITAVIPEFTVTPVINTPTFPEDIDQYNTELPAVIEAQQATTEQVNTLIPQLNTLEENVTELEASTLSASAIALAIANFKGTWLVGTSYPFPSSVVLNGVYYAALQANIGHTPPDATYWSPIPSINDVLPSLNNSYSSQHTQGLIDALQTEISNLASASLAIASSTDPVFAPISTTSTDMPFSVTVASTNTAVITASDGSDTITFLKDGVFNFASIVTIEATSTSAQTVTFDIIDTSDNSIIGTQTIPVSLAAARINAYPLNTLMTVGSNGVPSAPLTIKIKAKVSGGTGLNLKAYESVLSAQSIVNSSAVADSIHASPSKPTPSDSDELGFLDSTGAAWSLVKMTFAQMVTAISASIKNISYKSTPLTITSWSYVGTTITLNVASHTFVAGDYIEVSGLTSTTYPANGMQLVTSVTATTIVFTLGATPTGTAGVSSATVKGYATVNGSFSNRLEMGIAIASTSGTSIDFTGIPSWAKRITVMFKNISTNGTSAYQAQIGSGSPETSGYAGNYLQSTTTAAGVAATPSTGFNIAHPTSNNASYSGQLVLKLLTANTWIATCQVGDSANTRMEHSESYKITSATIDRIRITTVNGTDTFDAGLINIMYEG